MEGNSTQAQTQTPIPVSQPPSAPQDTSSNNTKLIGIALVVILVLVVSVLGFLFYNEVTRGDQDTGDSAVAPTQTPGESNFSGLDPNVVCAAFINLADALQNKEKACVLDLSGQELSELPEEVSQLTNLNQIILNNNSFTVFPDKLISIPSLIEIDIANNQISSLPPSISSMKNLQKLDVANNQLTSIPDSLVQVKPFNYLILTGNNIADPEKEKIRSLFPEKEGYAPVTIEF